MATPAAPTPLPLAEIAAGLEAALASSPADETELVWLEARRGQATPRGQSLPCSPGHRRILLIRVLERGRLGTYRTGDTAPAAIEAAVRVALAHARAAGPGSGLVHLPVESDPTPPIGGLHDPALAALRVDAAADLLEAHAQRGERARLEWSDGRVAVVNSRGLRRQAAVTTVSLDVRCDEQPGSGSAAAAARDLARLDVETVFLRARQRHVRGPAEAVPAVPLPAVLAGEAVVELFRLLRDVAFAAVAYTEGSSFLREHLGVQVFDRALSLRDDAGDPDGLPFPFDLEGSPKRPVDLIVAGTPRTPALDLQHAARLGLPATAHAVGGGDALPENLILLPGATTEPELLALADGGIWIGRLEGLECFDPRRMLVRARARGIRRIVGGHLDAPVEDLAWEDSLLRALAGVTGLGAVAAQRPSDDGLLGGVRAPSLALRELVGLRAL